MGIFDPKGGVEAPIPLKGGGVVAIPHHLVALVKNCLSDFDLRVELPVYRGRRSQDFRQIGSPRIPFAGTQEEIGNTIEVVPEPPGTKGHQIAACMAG